MRLAETPPAACSGCFMQQPESRHVDFESFWDGPTVPGGVTGADGQVRDTIAATIDDLILCEKCLTDAGRLIGLAPDGETAAKCAELERELGEARERLNGQADFIARLEAAAESRARIAPVGKAPRAQGPRKKPATGRKTGVAA